MTEAAVTTLLVLIDESNRRHVREGAAPYAELSHDRSAFHLAHEARRKGWRVLLGVAGWPLDAQPLREVVAVYPRWRLGAADDAALASVTILAGLHAHTLDVRHLVPNALIVALTPAAYFVENPAIFGGPAYVAALRRALATSIDVITVQNERMAEIMRIFYEVVAGWRHPDRILIAPFGIVPEEEIKHLPRHAVRRELGFADDDIVLINAGGIWKWTDFNTFLAAFISVVRSGHSRLKLLIMGLRQPVNDDHGAYIAATRRLLDDNRDLVGRHIVVLDDWKRGAELVKAYARAADVGINVNAESLENWQSYRVRCIEYMDAALAVLSTRGDHFSEVVARAATYPVEAGSVSSYEAALRSIVESADGLAARRAAMTGIRERYLSSRVTAGLLDQVSVMVPLPRTQPSAEAGEPPVREKQYLALAIIAVRPLVAGLRRMPLVRWLQPLAKALVARLRLRSDGAARPRHGGLIKLLQWVAPVDDPHPRGK